MSSKYKDSKLNGGRNEMKKCKKSLNVDEEYFHAFRTKSFADFFTKAQPLVHDDELSSPSNFHHTFSETLLEPGQETVTKILHSALHDTNSNPSFSRNSSSDLKAILANYFEISAEASKICTNLLKGTNKIQSHYKFIQQILENTLDDYYYHSSEQLNLIVVELRSFVDLKNPFSKNNKQDFNIIHEKYSSVLQILKLKKKRVARKMKMIKCFNKASGICVTAVCGFAAVTALAIASHALTALVLGPALFSLPIKPLKKKFKNFQFLRSCFLRKVGEQLDVAAKGSYIIDRDFDTMSRLVTRLYDDIEHNKEMIRLCLDKKEYKLSLQVLKELRNGDYVFTKQVEELEEHLYLCLVTINRARTLVIKELQKSCGRL